LWGGGTVGLRDASVWGTRIVAVVAPGSDGGVRSTIVVDGGVRGSRDVRMASDGAYTVRDVVASGMRGVGSVRGAVVVRDTSPLVRVLDASASRR
jgi:hypothetical protein